MPVKTAFVVLQVSPQLLQKPGQMSLPHLNINLGEGGREREGGLVKTTALSCGLLCELGPGKCGCFGLVWWAELGRGGFN